jgi:DNA-binding transcriptional regulator YiaG
MDERPVTGSDLEAIRVSLGLSRIQVARAWGASRHRIYNLEKLARVSAGTELRYMQALQVAAQQALEATAP